MPALWDVLPLQHLAHPQDPANNLKLHSSTRSSQNYLYSSKCFLFCRPPAQWTPAGGSSGLDFSGCRGVVDTGKAMDHVLSPLRPLVSLSAHRLVGKWIQIMQLWVKVLAWTDCGGSSSSISWCCRRRQVIVVTTIAAVFAVVTAVAGTITL